ncbi:MAG TPA: fructose-6-phosphate aldolase [Candidatus Bilamarchaeaceae archaeon]|nr:fructose-6-phosphate aldolase [Candidatus Bilamarchaeaceae archaeon]
MKFFLDTAEIDKIRAANELGLVDGVTTNPTLIMKAGKNHKEAIQEICKIVKGPVSVEGVAEKAEQMVKDAVEFAGWAPNVVAKLPMTTEGMKALRTLKHKGIRTNITLVFSPSQALIVGKLGADMVSPFIGRLDDISQDGMQLIRDIVMIYKNYDIKTEVLVASVRSPTHVMEAAKAGAHIATLPYKVFEQLFKHPLTDKGIEQFYEDYKKGVKR